MKTKRFFIAILCLATLCTPSFAASKASKFLDSYMVSLRADGNGIMVVTYGVYGTKNMSIIGADSITIEERIGSRWIQYEVFYGADYPEFYTRNSLSHQATLTFTGLPGVEYRAKLAAYAQNPQGSDIKELICTPKVCK